MKRVYLDYAATTPIDRAVEAEMKPYFGRPPAGGFGNPNSLHSFGQEARGAVDIARERAAKALGTGFENIVFTGSATEANNLALRGILKNYKLKTANKKINPRIIVSAIEHESVLETAEDLKDEGAEVIYLKVDRNGAADLKDLKKNLNHQTVLVSVMHANNETGIIQPVKEISKIVRDFRGKKDFPFFHTDAVQAFQFLDCKADNIGADLITLSAHKIYGPKGTGLVYIRNKKFISAVITGGGQESGLRSGTENVSGIAGFGKAIELADKNRKKESKRTSDLKGYFWKELEKIYPKARLNSDAKNVLPNILNIYFPGFSNSDLMIKLDMAGVAVSAGSACLVYASKPSYVLKAMGYPDERICSSLRFSFGKFVSKQDLTRALKSVKIALK